MPFHASSEIEIDKPLATVLQFVFEPTNEPYWVAGVMESHMLSVRPVGRGTQVQRIHKFTGRIIEYVYEMVEFDPEGYLKLLSLNSPVNFEIEYSIKKISENKTVFRQSVRGSYSGYLGMFDFIAARFVKNNLKKDLVHLKEILEKYDIQ